MARAASLALGTLALLYALVPILVVVASAFGGTSYLAFPPQGVTTRWFAAALAEPRYVSGFLASLVVATLAATASTVVGLMAAVALAHHRFPGRDAIEAAILSPLVLPTLTLAVGLTILFSRWGVPPGNGRLVLAHLAICVPYVVRVAVPVLQRLDPAIEEAARNLGASPVAAFLLATLPAIRPGAVAAATFAFIASFDELELALFLADPRRPTLPVTVYSAVQLGTDPTVAAASALLVGAALLAMIAYTALAGLRRA